MTILPQLINFEFRSNQEINGWPLIHINFGTNPQTGRVNVAKGLVAIGNIAFGVVSMGPVAFGLVSLGGIGIGIVSLAGISLGVVSLAGIAMGVIALGAFAWGYEFTLEAAHTIPVDFPFAAWVLIFAAVIGAAFWGLRRLKADRWES